MARRGSAEISPRVVVSDAHRARDVERELPVGFVVEAPVVVRDLELPEGVGASCHRCNERLRRQAFDLGGDSFVMVDAADLGVEILPENGRSLAEVGQRIRAAATEQLRFEHPELDWPAFSFCQIAGPLERLGEGEFTMRNTVVIDPGKLDRSPTGTGVSARLALLHAQGAAGVGATLRMRSIIDSEFVGRIESETTVGDVPAIVPLISGTAWRTGRYTYELDPTDLWPLGYRIGDTWPMS